MPKEDKNNSSIYVPKNHASGVGKNTLVIDQDIYGDLNSENPTANGSSFYGVTFRIWSPEYNSRDRFRIEMGNYWDLIAPGESAGVPIDPSQPDSPGELIYGYPIGLWTRFWYAHRLKYGTYGSGVIGESGDKGLSIAKQMQGHLPINIEHLGEVPDSKAAAYPNSYQLAKQTGAKLYSVSVAINIGNTRFNEIYSAIDEWRGYVYGTGDNPAIIYESTVNSIKIFDSNSFITAAPFSNLELEKMNSGPGAVAADIKTYYSPNFAFDNYIDTISSTAVNEYMLPNLYSFLILSEKEDEPSTFTNKLNHIISNITLTNQLQLAVNHKGEKLFPEMDLKDALHTMDREKYYNIYSYILSKVIANASSGDAVAQSVMDDSTAYENIIFTESTADMLREFSAYKSSFPMSTQISFRTDRDVDLTNLLNESFLMPAIIEKIVEVSDANMPASDKENTMFGIRSKQFVEYSDLYTIEENPVQDSKLVKTQKFNETIRNTWDIEKILNGYRSMGEDYINEKSDFHTVFFSTQELDFSDPASSIVKTILLAVFKNKMQDYIENRARTYEEILAGEHADSEIVLYRIEKSKLNPVTQLYEVVQNMYVPNSNKIDIANIIDTQVKYGVVYQYQVYAYHAVVGSEYSYWDVFAGGANLPMIQSPTEQINVPIATPELCEDDSSVVISGYDSAGNILYSSFGALENTCALPPDVEAPYEDNVIEPTGGPPLAVPGPVGVGTNQSDTDYSGQSTGAGSAISPGGSGTGVVTQPNVELPPPPLEDQESAPPYPDATLALNFNVMVRPTLKLVELPYFNTDPSKYSMVLDMPPLPPQVVPIPFRATKNKIMFLFDGSVGKENVLPVAIEPGDQELYDVHRLAQSVGAGEEITFNSDNPLVSFEIFRTVNPPTSYQDFKGKKVFTTSKTSYIDNINPNKKYYYMFRSLDSRGNISNPSPVYEIELVTLEDGSDLYKVAVLPKIKIYNFPQLAKDNFERSMRKYILIKPSREQATINEKVSKLPGSKENPTLNLDNIEPVIGVTERALFAVQDLSGSVMSNKKFKLRITSKTTGRKMDFNFEFKHKHKKPLLSY
jgi:hypothetical protein